jgi:benzodiazapine receptor
MQWIDWYNGLAKPSWTPAPSTIGLVWTILYPVIAVTFGYVFVQAYRRKIPRYLAVGFAINLLANLLFQPIFAGLRDIHLAAIDIVVVWVTILWCSAMIEPYYRWVAIAQIPYIVWVSIASVLQFSIVGMNK